MKIFWLLLAGLLLFAAYRWFKNKQENEEVEEITEPKKGPLFSAPASKSVNPDSNTKSSN